MIDATKYQNILVEVRDGIAFATFNRPQVRNAMSQLSWQELYDVIESAEGDERVRVIILTGAGEKAFVAGADINALAQLTSVANLSGFSRKALARMEACAKPIIAAVNGYAFGGGCEIALACDIRIISEKAQFALPETGLGIIPGAGGTQRLARIAGMGLAKEMIMGGKTVKAPEAIQRGLAMEMCAPEALMERAVAVANTMMAKGPVALSVAKSLIQASWNLDITNGVYMECLGLSTLLGSQDRQEGLTAFLEKRAPEYKGE